MTGGHRLDQPILAQITGSLGERVVAAIVMDDGGRG